MNFIEKKYFLLRKLHVLSGLIPIGVFFLVHLTVNSYALKGVSSYNERVAFMESLPFLSFMEIFIIAVPILYHALFGIWIVYVAKNNVLQYKYYRNWAFYLQRITAIITFVFLLYHVYSTRLAKLLYGVEVNFQLMTNILSSPAVLIFYIIGVVAAVYHFANGLWAFFIDMGITMGPHSQRISTYVTSGIFVALCILSVQILFAFRI